MAPAAAGLLWALLVASAPVAADPPGTVRGPALCVAQWSQPTPACPWRDRVQAKGVGRTEALARKHAVTRLQLALADLSRAAVMDAQGGAAQLGAARLLGCLHVAPEELTVQCSASPALAEDGLCFVQLPKDPCWSDGISSVEGRGWLVAEQARQQTCEAVGAQLQARSVPASEYLRCRARCQLEVQVRCGGQG